MCSPLSALHFPICLSKILSMFLCVLLEDISNVLQKYSFIARNPPYYILMPVWLLPAFACYLVHIYRNEMNMQIRGHEFIFCPVDLAQQAVQMNQMELLVFFLREMQMSPSMYLFQHWSFLFLAPNDPKSGKFKFI